MPKKVFVKNFGCQMNIRDSEFVTGLLLDNGFRLTDSVKGADVILFNSCSVRKHAEDRLFSNIAELKDLKKKRPSLVIGLMGCTAQAYKDKILERAPLVDLVCGPGNEADLPAIIKDVMKNACPIIAADKVNEKRPELFPKYRYGKFKASVSIGEGCNNFCSYCVVPYVRGRERSRDVEDIVKEVKGLAGRGFKEITLLGQNVNSYITSLAHSSKLIARRKKNGFIILLEALNKIEGIERIRFMTSHPKDASVELFKAMKDLDKVCEHLHLPIQSGSDRILKLMNRGYTAAKYLKLAESYKKIVPEGSLTTDIVVGFSTEADSDFKKTLDLLKKIRFDSVYTFKYSPRPLAKSARLEDDIPKDVKEKRLKTANDLQCKISEERNAPMIGKTVEILVDGCNKKDPSRFNGRTRTNKIAVFKGDKKLIGRFVDVKIESVTPYALKGRIVQ